MESQPVCPKKTFKFEDLKTLQSAIEEKYYFEMIIGWFTSTYTQYELNMIFTFFGTCLDVT